MLRVKEFIFLIYNKLQKLGLMNIMPGVIDRTSTLDEIKNTVKDGLERLYRDDQFIFERNDRRGVSERCIVFRFAHYLQLLIPTYFVDCDFNSSFEGFQLQNGRQIRRERKGKPIVNPDGSITNRFVDIIVHQRDFRTVNDFICFEIKKWNNKNTEEIEKDRNNLRILTSHYGYIYGFYITINREKSQSSWEIYHNGHCIEEGVIFQPPTS